MNQPYDRNAMPHGSPPPPPQQQQQWPQQQWPQQQWLQQQEGPDQQFCPGCGSASPLSAPFCGRCRRPFEGHRPFEGQQQPVQAGPPLQPQQAQRLRDPMVPRSPRRFLAALIDQGIAAVLLSVPLYLVVIGGDSGLTPVLVLAAGVLYLLGSIVAQGITGRTFGKWMLGLRTVSIVPGEDGMLCAPGISRSLWRTVILALANVLLYFGAWSVLLDGGRRGVADKLASTRVIDVRIIGDPLVAGQNEPSEDIAPRGFLRLQLTPEERAMMPTPVESVSVPRPSPATNSGPVINEVPGVGRDRESGPPVPKYQSRNVDPIRVVARTVVEPVPVPGPVPVSDQVEETRMVPTPVDRTRMTPAAVAVIRLEFDDGRTLEVAGAGLVGRDPSPEVGESVEHSVSMEDTTMSLSKTHLGFGVVKGVLWVEDRHSTNGSAWEYQTSRQSLVAGERTEVPTGATIHMGARTFRVTT